MSATIWKFPLEIVDGQLISIPELHTPLLVGLDPQGVPCLWCEVETGSKKRLYPFHVVGTGNPIPRTATKHVGSFVHGPFVWHLYRGTLP